MTKTVTQIVSYSESTPTLDGINAIVTAMADNRRESILRELSGLERTLGYGNDGKPTTSQLRKWWRENCGKCPHCGKVIA